MVDKIIKLLGGYTKLEYHLTDKEYSQQYHLVQILRERESQLLKQFEQEKQERQRLQEIIFKKFNILPEENSSSIQDDPELKPIKTSPRRWSELRTAMEQDDRERVKAHA